MDRLKPPPQKVILSADLLQDARKQDLQVIFSPYQGCQIVPAEVGQNGVAFLAFQGLLQCFEKTGNISEGQLKDILWGFEQSGHDPRAVAAGLTKLRALGYTYYTDPLGNRISEHNFDPKKAIWLRYSSKFLALMVRR